MQQQISDLQNQITALQKPTQPTNKTIDWSTYTSENLGISFQYPKDWYVKEERETGSGYRIYIRNVEGGASKADMPLNF